MSRERRRLGLALRWRLALAVMLCVEALISQENGILSIELEGPRADCRKRP